MVPITRLANEYSVRASRGFLIHLLLAFGGRARGQGSSSLKLVLILYRSSVSFAPEKKLHASEIVILLYSTDLTPQSHSLPCMRMRTSAVPSGHSTR